MLRKGERGGVTGGGGGRREGASAGRLLSVERKRYEGAAVPKGATAGVRRAPDHYSRANYRIELSISL